MECLVQHKLQCKAYASNTLLRANCCAYLWSLFNSQISFNLSEDFKTQRRSIL